MRPACLPLAAALMFFAAGCAAQTETAANTVTSLLGQPLAPMALEPDSAARMEAQLADAVAAAIEGTDI